MLTSSQGEAIAERGGRAKKFYAVTGQGKQALNRAKNALDTLWQGVQLSKLAHYA